MRYAFDRFILDTDRCALTRDGVSIRLRPKICDLLAYLLDRAGTVALKDDILSAVWPGVTVAEDSLPQAVANLRQALGAGGAHLIRTIPRRGYALDVAVAHLPAEPPPRRAGSRSKRPWIAMALLAAAAAAVAMLARPGAIAPPAPPRTILATATTAIGQRIDLPAGAAQIVATIKTLPAGAASDWHRHEAPLLAYVLSGEVAIDYRDRGTQRFTEGAVVVEAVDWPHQARNEGRRAAEILVIELREATGDTDLGPSTGPGRPESVEPPPRISTGAAVGRGSGRD